MCFWPAPQSPTATGPPGHSQLCPETKLIRPHLELTTWVQLFDLEQPRDLGIPSSASGMAQSKKEPLPQCGRRQI